MVESADADRLPAFGIVTLQTIGSQPTLVLVFVAGGAARRNPQECPIKIFEFDTLTFARRNVRGIVAAVTADARVFSLKRITGLAVIECLDIPLDEIEVFAIVLGVASRAFRARINRAVICSVQSFSGAHSCRDLAVATQALECGFASRDFVTGGAFRYSIE